MNEDQNQTTESPQNTTASCPVLPRKRRKFRWTPAKDEAALSLCNKKLTKQQIAEKAGVCRRTLRNWRTHPEFIARVAEHRAELNRRLREALFGPKGLPRNLTLRDLDRLFRSP